MTRALSVLLGVLPLMYCLDPLAPDDATVSLSVEPPRIPVDSGSATVRATILVATGDLLPYDADITFFVDGGSLCVDVGCDRSVAELPPALTVTTRDGVGLVTFRSGRLADTITVIARSGNATDTAQIIVETP